MMYQMNGKSVRPSYTDQIPSKKLIDDAKDEICPTTIKKQEHEDDNQDTLSNSGDEESTGVKNKDHGKSNHTD